MRELIFFIALIITSSCIEPNNNKQFNRAKLPIPGVNSTAGATIIDFNNDGNLDIYLSNGYNVMKEEIKPQINVLLKNKGDGNFELVKNELTKYANPTSASIWVDVDKDGDLDVINFNQQNFPNEIYINKNGEFTLNTNLLADSIGHSYSGTFGDFNNDGNEDIYVTNGGLSHKDVNYYYEYSSAKEMFVRSERIFTQDSGMYIGEVWTHLNDDDLLDLYQPDRYGDEYLYIAKENGSYERKTIPFTKEQILFSSATAAAWDYNRDNDIDIAQTFMYGGNTVIIENLGNGKFKPTSLPDGANSYACLWFDQDNNGWADLLILNWGSAPIFFSNTEGKLTQEHIPGLTDEILYTGGASAGDLNNDGLQDLVLTQWPNYESEEWPNYIYYNTSTTNNNWVEIKIESKRNLTGSRVTLYDGTGTHLQVINNQRSWRSFSSPIIHFGLGNEDVIDKIEIKTTDGNIHVFRDIEVNKINNIAL